jgi:hypothetical protein
MAASPSTREAIGRKYERISSIARIMALPDITVGSGRSPCQAHGRYSSTTATRSAYPRAFPSTPIIRPPACRSCACISRAKSVSASAASSVAFTNTGTGEPSSATLVSSRVSLQRASVARETLTVPPGRANGRALGQQYKNGAGKPSSASLNAAANRSGWMVRSRRQKGRSVPLEYRCMLFSQPGWRGRPGGGAIDQTQWTGGAS